MTERAITHIGKIAYVARLVCLGLEQIILNQEERGR